MTVKFIPFAEWNPDAPEYGEGALKEAKNLLPLYYGYRPLRQKLVVTEEADGPPTGSHVHFYQQTLEAQTIRPDADDNNAGAWVNFDGSADLYVAIDEESPSDADRVYSPGTASAAVVIFGLSDGATPGSTSGHVISWRYKIENATGSWTLKTELLEAGSTVIATDTLTSSGVTDWTQRTLTLSAGEAGNITDYTDLSVRFTATVAGAVQTARPTSDSSVGGWTTQAGGSTNLYATLDETSPSDADYVQSPAISIGGTQTYKFKFGSVTDPLVSSGHVVKYRYRGTNTGCNLTVNLKQGSTTIATWSHGSISTSFATATQTLSSSEADAITDYGDLYLEFVGAFPTDVTSTVFQESAPTSDVSDGGETIADIVLWGKTGGTWHASTLSNDGDNIFTAQSPAGTNLGPIVMGLATASDPMTDNDHSLVFRARESFLSGTINVSWILLHNGISIASGNHTVSGGSYTDYTTSLSSAIIASITDYSALRVSVQANLSNAGLAIDRIYLKSPAQRRIEVSWSEFEVPSIDRIGVSWLEMSLPDPNDTFQPDKVTVYVGTDTELYEVEESGFTEVSLAGGYAAGTVNPTGWYFTTWGDEVIATNKADAVQIQATRGADFANLITSSDKPKARFVTTLRNQVLLGDINLSGHFADEVWWSAQDDATTFESSVTSRSDFQRLLQTPGQVMGLVGGEYAIVFKRNSVLRLDFNPSVIYEASVLSAAVGTPFPRSIVKVDNDIYFRGAGEFWVLRGGYELQTVGDGVLSKFFKDTSFSEGALRQRSLVDPRLEDQAMFGAYDTVAGIIVWVYSHVDDTDDYKHHRFVTYNVRENRWGMGNASGLDLACLNSLPSITTADTHALKGIIGFDWDGTNTGWLRFSGSETYEAELKSRIFTLSEAGYNVMVHGIRPIFHTDTNDETWPTLTFSVDSADDPRMLLDVNTKTGTTADASNEGWVPWHQSGEYWRVTVTVPEMSQKMLKEFQGVYIDYTVEGQR